MAVVLADLLSETQIVLDLQADSFIDAVREIAATMTGEGKLREPEKFIAQVEAREQSVTTYIGNGIALPHARTDLVPQILLGIGRSRAGVLFPGADEPARLVFLVAVPQRMVTDYLVCVGALARLTREEKTRAALQSAPDPAAFAAILREGSLLLE